MPILPGVALPEPSDSNLNQQLAASDAEALAALDAPEVVAPVEEPVTVEVPVDTTVPAPPESEVKPDAPTAADDDDKALDEELDKLQPRKGAHPNTFKMAEVLRGVIKRERAERKLEAAARKDAESKLASVETEYKGKAITPEIESELKDLRELRREVQLESDPEFQQKFLNKKTEIDREALSVLRNEKLTPELEKFITDNGGVVAMYHSTKQMPPPYQSDTHSSFISSTLMDKLSPVGGRIFLDSLVAGAKLREAMSREIEDIKKNGSERQKQKQQEIQDAFNKSAQETRKSFGKMAEKWDVPVTASKEEKAKIDKHNARVEKAEALFQDYVSSGSKNPAKVAEALAKAAQSQYLMEEAEEKDLELAARDAKIKELEDRLTKIKASGSTGKSSSAPAPSSKPEPGKIMSDAEAFAEFEKGK